MKETENTPTEVTAVKKGQRVFFKPEWQDEGDETIEHVAREDSKGNRVAVTALLGMGGLNPWNYVELRMIERVEDYLNRPEIIAAINAPKWEPRLSVEVGADYVWSQLDRNDIAYAGDPERGEYRGFAALHDRCDANMLLPDAEDYDAGNEEQTLYLNRVMDEVSRRLIATWDEWKALADH